MRCPNCGNQVEPDETEHGRCPHCCCLLLDKPQVRELPAPEMAVVSE